MAVDSYYLWREIAAFLVSVPQDFHLFCKGSSNSNLLGVDFQSLVSGFWEKEHLDFWSNPGTLSFLIICKILRLKSFGRERHSHFKGYTNLLCCNKAVIWKTDSDVGY